MILADEELFTHRALMKTNRAADLCLGSSILFLAPKPVSKP